MSELIGGKSPENILEKAKRLAEKWHSDINHKYDGKPYTFHLDMVDSVALMFLHLIPENKREIVRAGGRVHDTVEDTGKTFNDVKEELGVEVAELAYALTNEKGRNRKERANKKYYKGIRNTPYAPFIKLCDRIANMSHSRQTGSSMFYKYQKENSEFCTHLYGPVWLRFFQFFGLFRSRPNVKKLYKEMFVYLNKIAKGDSLE